MLQKYNKITYEGNYYIDEWIEDSKVAKNMAKNEWKDPVNNLLPSVGKDKHNDKDQEDFFNRDSDNNR